MRRRLGAAAVTFTVESSGALTVVDDRVDATDDRLARCFETLDGLEPL